MSILRPNIYTHYALRLVAAEPGRLWRNLWLTYICTVADYWTYAFGGIAAFVCLILLVPVDAGLSLGLAEWALVLLILSQMPVILLLRRESTATWRCTDGLREASETVIEICVVLFCSGIALLGFLIAALLVFAWLTL